MNERVVDEAIFLVCSNLHKEQNLPEPLRLLLAKAITDLTSHDISSQELEDLETSEKFTQMSRIKDVQSYLSTINEVSSIRKERGVFYTPGDVVDLVLAHTVNEYFNCSSSADLFNHISEDIDISRFAFEVSVFDPTCGLGEFLLGALKLKINTLKNRGIKIGVNDLKIILGTLYGNDIDPDSIAICKLRLFFEIATQYGTDLALECYPVLLETFTQVDFVNISSTPTRRFDLIVGNPPYVEDRKYGEINPSYGNIYCNVLINSIDFLTEDGVTGFIIPLSYVSTPRMKNFRDKLIHHLPNQIILSFADRPNSLFKKVHQKLCIVIASSKPNAKIYTSNYTYWYKDQRQETLAHLRVVRNNFLNGTIIPKLGTKTDIEIFNKILNTEHHNAYEISRAGNHTVCLNSRESFWIKVFRDSRNHPEFKEFHFDTKELASYFYCVLNSSLFWWYWIAVSDCWHVSKDLNGFRLPVPESVCDFEKLADSLEQKLEDTKKFVGTKQTEYEYKHSNCLDIIHDIDDVVCNLFELDEKETKYIKEFALEYRTSRKMRNI